MRKTALSSAPDDEAPAFIERLITEGQVIGSVWSSGGTTWVISTDPADPYPANERPVPGSPEERS